MRALTIIKTIVTVSILAIALPALADLEIIPLRHRTVDQVLPVLRPLLEPGGVLSGQNNQLIVRTSARNLEEIRRVLAHIDTPQRRLMISVRFDSKAQARDRSIDARGTVRAGNATITNQRLPANRSSVSINARANQATGSERVDQRIQVLDGGHAFISTGESRPIRQGIVTVTPSGRTITQGTEIQSAQTGFDVVPRVSGTQVFLDIAPQRETFADSGARGRASTVHSQRAATTLSARLGEWFEIGGVAQTASGSTGGIGSSREASASSGRRIWVRVDEVRP